MTSHNLFAPHHGVYGTGKGQENSPIKYISVALVNLGAGGRDTFSSLGKELPHSTTHEA